jgi:GT2 family glycosyltransferase
MRRRKLSVILCTYNPNEIALQRCLGSLAKQDIAASDYELIVVDNCSKPPLDKAKLERFAGRNVTLVREMRPGLVHARVAGFQTAKHSVLVFIDDDNEFFPDYLSMASQIARDEPKLGVFGGRCVGAYEKQPSRIKNFFLPYLGVREPGDEPLTGEGDAWGPHEPIGAGIVVRKPIGKLFSRFVNGNVAGGGLGRSGNQLLAGEDSLLSRFAHEAGYLCGYRPQLKLYHHIEPRRFGWRYLARLMRGHGTSYVRLARIKGTHFEAVDAATVRTMVLKNFLWRLRKEGLMAASSHVFWDLGFYEAVNEEQATALVPPLQPLAASPALDDSK